MLMMLFLVSALSRGAATAYFAATVHMRRQCLGSIAVDISTAIDVGLYLLAKQPLAVDIATTIDLQKCLLGCAGKVHIATAVDVYVY